MKCIQNFIKVFDLKTYIIVVIAVIELFVLVIHFHPTQISLGKAKSLPFEYCLFRGSTLGALTGSYEPLRDSALKAGSLPYSDMLD